MDAISTTLNIYIQSLTQNSPLDRPLTGLTEQLILREQRPAHVLSTIYNYFLPNNMGEELTYLTK